MVYENAGERSGGFSAKGGWRRGTRSTGALSERGDSLMGHRVRRAIIPAGGLGRRMDPLTRAKPKEMLPVGGRPMIRWCIEEAFLSGIEEIGIVLNQEKRSIRDYLSRQPTTERQGDDTVFGEALERCAFRFIEQPVPHGSGDAVYRCRSFVADEPFAVMMPDFVLLNSPPALGQMIEALGEGRNSAVGFLRLDSEKARTFGNVGVLETEAIEGPLHRIMTLSDKKPGMLILSKGAEMSKAVGRQILQPDFFEVFDTTNWKIKGERDDVPVIQGLIEEGEFLGVCLQGFGFDIGNPQGYQAANEYLRQYPVSDV